MNISVSVLLSQSQNSLIKNKFVYASAYINTQAAMRYFVRLRDMDRCSALEEVSGLGLRLVGKVY